MEKATLYLTPSFSEALAIKVQVGCPHIHYSIEPECNPFTANLVWVDVLHKALTNAIKHGACVVSYPQLPSLSGKLSSEDIEIIKKAECALEDLKPQVDFIYL
jgi:hypothetical protein